MPDEMIDKKITQGQADRMAAPLELDLWAVFKVMEEDMLKLAEDYEGTPEGFIEEVTNLLLPGGGETMVNKELNMSCKVKKTCTPRGGEDKDAFISRCISTEVKAGSSQDEASGKCYAIWREVKKGQVKKELAAGILKARVAIEKAKNNK